jgi:hypothetical protein
MANNPKISYDVARGIWNTWALREDLEIVQVVDGVTKRKVKVLRKKV